MVRLGSLLGALVPPVTRPDVTELDLTEVAEFFTSLRDIAGSTQNVVLAC